ncbi:MAG: hypothetical protein GF317_24000 [Candidatus Lokiarchaeota archaeon]|nr:hypothetical protein [Candidatus Lokiarchaeota archaeon]MBD3202437.1 hypothetical protein [Candidatus Lokiarchaeota archaeon]
MTRKFRCYLILICILLGISIVAINPTQIYEPNENIDPIHVKTSISIEGLENIQIYEIDRNVNLSGFGLVTIKDSLAIKNQNNNPIDSVIIAIPKEEINNLIYYETKGEVENTLFTEITDMILMNKFQMIAIYFDTPLLPSDTRRITFIQTYKNQMNYQPFSNKQGVSFSGYVFPLIPYRAVNNIKATFYVPKSSTIEFNDWGTVETLTKTIEFSINDLQISSIEPYLGNMDENATIQIDFSDNALTRLEIIDLERQLYISPWGILEIKETIKIKNLGNISISEFNFKIPSSAINVLTYDYLGTVLGTEVSQDSLDSKYSIVSMNFRENRVELTPGSEFQFNIKYQLPLTDYLSIDWFQQSVLLDIYITDFEILCLSVTTNVIIEGSSVITYLSESQEEVRNIQSRTILTYHSDFISPLEEKRLLITYNIDIFDLSLRPITLMIFITIILSTVVLLIKKREKIEVFGTIAEETIPVNDVREFCSLYEEKIALLFEIRQAEMDLKSRKLAKKKYRNLVDSNQTKIRNIENEIKSFKEELINTNETFENIIKKIDVLEAERQTVEDGLKLLESRYKKGKLPSKAAYVKLSNDFLKRRKKIDRTIDKFIQQLRTYLL